MMSAVRPPDISSLVTKSAIATDGRLPLCMQFPIRFRSAPQFSSYCGTTPRVSSSGGKTRYGKLRTESNQYLKWAFIEAANAISAHHAQRSWTARHVSKLYLRIRSRKGSSVAIGAVARHLAESTFWVLTKNEPYRESSKVSRRQG